MENSVDEIKKKLDIVEFLGSFIGLKKAGRNFKAVCPFHQEKSPSFVVSPERQIWHCFGACGEGGDVIKFLMKWENISFYEALKELAHKTGVKLVRSGQEDKVWQKKERYFEMNSLAADYFSHVLNKTSFGTKALEYLSGRMVKPAIIASFQIGYSPNSWHSLRNFLLKKKFSDSEIADNGLVIRNEKGGIYDRFRGRLMFPIKDGRGNILAFSGRILEGKPTDAKYINGPETPVYRKRETLFGINLARDSIRKSENVYVVEGEFDMITPFQHGFTNFVAIKGTALTTEQLMLLKRYTNNVTLVFDSDSAGEESAKRGIEEAEKLDLDVKVVRISYAKDPDEAIRSDPVKFKQAMENPVPIYDFLIDAARNKFADDSVYAKKHIAESVLPVISRLNNPIIKSHYVKKLSILLEVSESSVFNMMSQLNRKKLKSRTPTPDMKTPTEGRALLIERYVLSLLFQQNDPVSFGKKVFSVLDPDDFILPVHQKISRLFLEKNEGKEFLANEFAASLPGELKPGFDETYLFASSDHDFDNENIEKLLLEIKRFRLKREIKDGLKGAGVGGNTGRPLESLTGGLKEVEKKLLSL